MNLHIEKKIKTTIVFELVFHVSLCDMYLKLSFIKCAFSSCLSGTMAGTMALFQTVQKIYETMAIHPSRSQPNRFHSLNVKLQFFLLINIFILITASGFFVFKANTIQALSDSFYVSLTHVFCLIYITIKIWKVTAILQLIDQFELFIRKRKLENFLICLEETLCSIKKN